MTAALPSFNTERFTVSPLTPGKLRALGVLDDALPVEAWAVLDRARRRHVGAVLARRTAGGVELEVLSRSRSGRQGMSAEVREQVAEWLHCPG